MKKQLPILPPKDLKESYPEQYEIGRWFDSIIPHPMQVFLVTTKKPNGLNNIQVNAWGMTAGPGSSPYFIFNLMGWDETFQFIKETGEFTINLFPTQYRENALRGAEHYDESTDEVIASGLTPIEGLVNQSCRIKECVAHYECKLEWIQPLGESQALIAGKIAAVSVEENLLNANFRERLDMIDLLYYLKETLEFKDGVWQGNGTSTFATLDKNLFFK